jgi:hypothetical protein
VCTVVNRSDKPMLSLPPSESRSRCCRASGSKNCHRRAAGLESHHRRAAGSGKRRRRASRLGCHRRRTTESGSHRRPAAGSGSSRRSCVRRLSSRASQATTAFCSRDPPPPHALGEPSPRTRLGEHCHSCIEVGC